MTVNMNVKVSSDIEKARASSALGDFIKKIVPWIFALLTLFALFVGFRLRKFEYLSADEGMGYALGIIGGSLMLALLLYPLRKRYKVLRLIGNVKSWFRIHMVFGVLGPVLILFHSNFSLGSTNSNVALFSMLIVSASGVVGRYIYTRIHHGLYGQKMELAQLKNSLHHEHEEIADLKHLIPEARANLFEFVGHVLTPPRGLFHSWERVMSLGIRSRILVGKTRKAVQLDMITNPETRDYSKKEQRRRVKLVVDECREFLKQTRGVVGFNFYERMFALWHVLHLPLFFMLVLAAIVHVIAVHYY